MGAAASEVKNKEGRKLIRVYQKKHRSLTQSKDDRHMLRLFNMYGGRKGYLDEREAKIFIRDVLFVCEISRELPDLQATIDAIFIELDTTHSNRVVYQELLKPSWGKVQDLLHTVYGKMNKLKNPNASETESLGKSSTFSSTPTTPTATPTATPTTISQPPSLRVTRVDSSNELSESELEECCPPSFICPISTEIMSDPVILVETGTTYDRKSIEQWLQNNSTDPSTGLQIKSKETLHILALKNAIEEWKEDMREMQKMKKEKKEAREREKIEREHEEQEKLKNNIVEELEKGEELEKLENDIVEELEKAEKEEIQLEKLEIRENQSAGPQDFVSIWDNEYSDQNEVQKNEENTDQDYSYLTRSQNAEISEEKSDWSE